MNSPAKWSYPHWPLVGFKSNNTYFITFFYPDIYASGSLMKLPRSKETPFAFQMGALLSTLVLLLHFEMGGKKGKSYLTFFFIIARLLWKHRKEPRFCGVLIGKRELCYMYLRQFEWLFVLQECKCIYLFEEEFVGKVKIKSVKLIFE